MNMIRICVGCNGKMVQKPLFRFFFDECPKCDSPETFSKTEKEDVMINLTDDDLSFYDLTQEQIDAILKDWDKK